jgi:uncharacterized membrane protein (DUF106 family)
MFYLGLAFILLHEMDAVRCHEWRIFPGLSLLSDSVGFIVFMFVHIPLYYWLLWNVIAGANPQAFIRGFDYFLIIHLGLHVLFLKHPKNEFKDWISWVIIAGAAVCGALDLLLR